MLGNRKQKWIKGNLNKIIITFSAAKLLGTIGSVIYLMNNEKQKEKNIERKNVIKITNNSDHIGLLWIPHNFP